METQSVFQFTDYREYLRQVFNLRMKKNPQYSLRAFSNQLTIYPSQLSSVFSNKKHLSYSSGLKIGKKLGLDDDETEYFCLMIQQLTAKTPSERSQAVKRMTVLNPSRSTQDLSVDVFQMISDWYHIPILMMTSLPGIKFSAKTVAKRLILSDLQATEALERLLRIGLLEKTANGSFKRSYKDGIFGTDQANLGLRNFHKTMLEKAADSLQTQTNAEKFVGSETFGLDPKYLPELKKTIEKFFSKCIKQAKVAGNESEIYHLGVQCFRLTRKA